MRDPQLNTRVDEEVRDAVEEYAEREQTNKSTAVRQFLLTGMEQMGEKPEGVETPATAKAATDGGYSLPARLRGWFFTVAGNLALLTVLAVSFGVVFSPVGGLAWQVGLLSAIYAVLSLLTAAVLYWYEHGTIDSGALSPGAGA